MIQVYKIDSNGYFMEPVILQNEQPIPSDCVTTPLGMDGLHKPQYVDGQWVEGLDQATLLSLVKTTKKVQLQPAFQASLLNGFTSSADGTSRTYAIDPVAMQKWTGALAVINSGKLTSNITVKDFSGNSVTLTPAQFQQMAADGFSFFNNQEAHLWGLEGNVDADATDTVDKVNAITW